ncbi:MAG: glycosyltransferase, partial [Acidobacteria bacterium]|nr:glycosyltransferase [Acidobacteriota bacterium]
MRILQLIGSLNFGGAEDVLVKLATGLTAAGHDVHVCATLGLGPLADRLRTRGISVERAGPNGRLHNYLRPWHVHDAIRRFQPDIVHTHGLPPLAEVSQVAAVHLGPRWVHTFHFGNYPHTEKRRHMHVERVGATAPDALVAVSDRQRDQLIRYHRIAPSRIRTILNGVEPNPFVADGETRRRKRAELGISDAAWVVGSIAVLTEQKGMSYLLQSARDIIAARPDARIVIVGGGPLEASLRAEAAAVGLGDSVIFTSWRADALELLAAFDVYVMASLWEAMPIALLEAMAAARA